MGVTHFVRLSFVALLLGACVPDLELELTPIPDAPIDDLDSALDADPDSDSDSDPDLDMLPDRAPDAPPADADADATGDADTDASDGESADLAVDGEVGVGDAQDADGDDTPVPDIRSDADTADLADAADAVETGDPVRGGLLYEEWWSAIEAEAPETEFPLYATGAGTATGAATWSCQVCHGSDYRGVDGAYSEGPSYTGFPGVWAARERTAQALLRSLNGTDNAEHDFSSLFAPQDLADLIAFFREEMIDMEPLIDRETGLSTGRVRDGRTPYGAVCARCHGPHGQTYNIGDADPPVHLREASRRDPWRALHRIRFGGAVGGMPAAVGGLLSVDEQVDVLRYIQSLPEAE